MKTVLINTTSVAFSMVKSFEKLVFILSGQGICYLLWTVKFHYINKNVPVDHVLKQMKLVSWQGQFRQAFCFFLVALCNVRIVPHFRL
jgi:hypothetical protein